jgi:signal transduction histidine kinase
MLENGRAGARLIPLIDPRQLASRFRIKACAALFLVIGLMGANPPSGRAQATNGPDSSRPKRVLLIFSEARDLPGNAMMEQAVRAEILKRSTNRVEFFPESMDASHFQNPRYYNLFRDYLASKYAGQNLDLAMLFMGRDFVLAQELATTPFTNLPSVFVVINHLSLPQRLEGRDFTGILQRFDVQGTMKFIFQLQPETRHLVVVGGTSPADQVVLESIQETARSVDGLTFAYWTNQPITKICQAARTLPADTVILLSTVQRDADGQPTYTAQVASVLAPAADVPVYVLGNGLIGTGAVGGNVVDFEELGASAGNLASRVLDGTPANQIPVELKSNGVPMVDWRALERWHIKFHRLPANCAILYQPHSLWEDHWELLLFIATGLLAQAITIAALLFQRKRQRDAEDEILRQRTELAHVSRVSMLGQLASALTHELNQPLGAILRNAEAAEVYLQSEPPNLSEVRAILTDIRRDDKRAGNVIDGMRSLFKRQKLALGTLDLRNLVEDTIAMSRPDAAARHVKLKVEIPPELPAARGDRVHVQQVLLNLILNGMDAMNSIPKSRRSLVVRVAETKNGNLQVAVRDRGTGIAPDNASHVFEPFFSTKSNGMGMGLAISKTIIEAHGGEIWMQTSGTDGTTFTFLLPPVGSDKVKAGDLPGSP